MKTESMYATLNKRKIAQELEQIDDDMIIYLIYRFIVNMRKGTKNEL